MLEQSLQMPVQSAYLLLVEDDNEIRESIRDLLEYEGFKVKEASNGIDALTQLRGGNEPPRLIILDMMMPEMSGFDVLARLRAQDDGTDTIPVIMLTGVSDKNKIRQAIDSGIDYYIVKPFEFHDLISKVKTAISDAESSRRT